MKAQEFYDSLMTENVKPAESAGVSANLLRKVLEAKLRMTVYILYTLKIPALQEEAGKILLCGEGSNEYYDLISTFIEFVDKIDGSDRLFTRLIESLNFFCSKVEEQVYCQVVREFSLKHCDNSRNSNLFSWVSIIHVLIVECYKRGMQSCGWNGSRVSISATTDVTLLELLVMIAENEPNIKGYFPIRNKDLKAVKNLLTLLNDASIPEVCANFLYSLDRAGLLSKFIYMCPYAALANLYSDHQQPNFCVQFSGVRWGDNEATELAKGSLAHIVESAGVDLLKYRRLLLNSSGVTLQFKKSFGSVAEVHLHEVHQDSLHYIYLRYKIEQGMCREIVLNIEDIKSSFYGIVYETDCNLVVGVLCWLGLKDVLLRGVDNLGELFDPLRDCLKAWIEDISNDFIDENLYYCEPSWWNYKQTKSRSVKHFVEYSKRIQIATHSRKLPKGQQASESAKALAEEYCMVLESGYTLVGSFERKQKVKRGVTEKES